MIRPRIAISKETEQQLKATAYNKGVSFQDFLLELILKGYQNTFVTTELSD